MDPTKEQIDALVAELEQELEPMLKAERVAKGEGSPPQSDEQSSPSESPSPEAPPESPAGGPPPSADPSASASPPPGAPPSAPPPGPGASPGLPADPAQLAQMIAQLPPEQQEALYMAAKQAIFARGGPSPSADASAPPPGSPPPAASPAPVPPPTMKAEQSPSPGNGSGSLHPKPGHVGKSEPADALAKLIKGLQDQVASLQKSQSHQADLVGKAIAAITRTPIRKALTEVPYLGKSEESPVDSMTRPEIDRKLKSLDKSRLSKADRQKINQFYESYGADVGPIKHLLQPQA
jgi:hypothetical protein